MIVKWDAAPRAAVYSVLGGNSADALLVIATMPDTQFVDVSLGDGRTRAYRIIAVNDAGESAPSSLVTATTWASWTFQGTPGPASIRLTWPPFQSATYYRPYCAAGLDTRQADVTDTTHLFDNLQERTSYLCTIYAMGPRGQIAASPSLPLVAGPLLPGLVPITAFKILGKAVQLTLQVDPRANDYMIARADAQSPNTFDILGHGTTTLFTDDTAVAWHAYYYRVWGENESGAGPPYESGPFNTRGPADQVNLGPFVSAIVVDDEIDPAQTFTVGEGGTLRGIEVSVASVEQYYLQHPILLLEFPSGEVISAVGLADFAPCCLPPTLVRDIPSIYFDLSAAKLFVSAGEHLRFEMARRRVGGNNAAVGTTADIYDGGIAFVSGVPAPDRDLMFQTFVEPSAQLVRPGPFAYENVPGAVRLWWNPSPAAIEYSILRGTSLADVAEIGRTVEMDYYDTTIVPGTTYTYVVRALDAAAHSADSAPYVVTASSIRVDSSCLGHNPPAIITVGPFDPATSIGQSVTVAQPGYIVAIEVSAVLAPWSIVRSSDNFIATVRDVAGNYLTSSNIPVGALEGCCTPQPLDPTSIGRAYFPMLQPWPAVKAGDTVRVELAPDWRVNLASGSGCYDGGTAFTPDGGLPDQELWFKLIMR